MPRDSRGRFTGRARSASPAFFTPDKDPTQTSLMRELHDTAMMMQSQHSDEQIAELRKEFAATADENKELRQSRILARAAAHSSKEDADKAARAEQAMLETLEEERSMRRQADAAKSGIEKQFTTLQELVEALQRQVEQSQVERMKEEPWITPDQRRSQPQGERSLSGPVAAYQPWQPPTPDRQWSQPQGERSLSGPVAAYQPWHPPMVQAPAWQQPPAEPTTWQQTQQPWQHSQSHYQQQSWAATGPGQNSNCVVQPSRARVNLNKLHYKIHDQSNPRKLAEWMASLRSYFSARYPRHANSVLGQLWDSANEAHQRYLDADPRYRSMIEPVHAQLSEEEQQVHHQICGEVMEAMPYEVRVYTEQKAMKHGRCSLMTDGLFKARCMFMPSSSDAQDEARKALEEPKEVSPAGLETFLCKFEQDVIQLVDIGVFTPTDNFSPTLAALRNTIKGAGVNGDFAHAMRDWLLHHPVPVRRVSIDYLWSYHQMLLGLACAYYPAHMMRPKSNTQSAPRAHVAHTEHVAEVEEWTDATVQAHAASKGKGKKGSDGCRKCGSQEHWARECPMADDPNKATGKCVRCVDTSCTRPDGRCMHLGTEKKCDACGQSGHDDKSCWKKHASLRPEQPKGKSGGAKAKGKGKGMKGMPKANAATDDHYDNEWPDIETEEYEDFPQPQPGGAAESCE